MTLVEFHPEATNEAAAARRWYAARSARAAARFADAIDQAIEATAENPSQAAMYLAGTRRVVLRRFPYLIVYRENAERIQVVAVAHGKRRPGYWKNRT